MDDTEQPQQPAAPTPAASTPAAPALRGQALRLALLKTLPTVPPRERRPEQSLDTESELRAIAECDVDELLTPLEKLAARTR